MQQSQNIKSDQKLDRALIIYKNGYKISEEGEFKTVEQNEHKQFMQQIKRGYFINFFFLLFVYFFG